MVKKNFKTKNSFGSLIIILLIAFAAFIIFASNVSAIFALCGLGTVCTAPTCTVNFDDGHKIEGTTSDNIRCEIKIGSTIATFAGTGTAGFSGDGGLATSAQLNFPGDVAVDNIGNVYIADKGRIRKVDVNGIITTIAGTGIAGSIGDGGPATLAQLNLPWGVAVKNFNKFYIADAGNFRIRSASPTSLLPEGIKEVTGTVSVTAGTDGRFGDILTISGGVSGGIITIVDVSGVPTTELTVPANTLTTAILDNLGQISVESINAPGVPLRVKNIRGFGNINGFMKHEGFGATMDLSPGQSYNLGHDVTISEGKVSAPLTNIGNVQFTIGKEDNTIGGELAPNEGFEFSGKTVTSGQPMLKFYTTSGLANPVEYSSGSTNDGTCNPPRPDCKYCNRGVPSGCSSEIVKIKMGDQQGVEFIFANPDLSSNKADLILLPFAPSGIVEGVSILSYGDYVPYSVKARRISSIEVAKGANYESDITGDGVPDLNFNSREDNTFFANTPEYTQLSTTKANGANALFLSSAPQTSLMTTVTLGGVSQTKGLKPNGATAYNFMTARDPRGNIVTVAGKSSIFSGSELEVISPEAIIEGWNSFYAATDNNYWNWNVALESLPSGCVADKESASETVDSEIKTITFYVDCSGGSSLTTGSVVSGFAPVGFTGKKADELRGKASTIITAEDCTQKAGDKHVCKPVVEESISSSVIKGNIVPGITGRTVLAGLDSGNISIIISLLTLIGIIALLFLIERKRALYK